MRNGVGDPGWRVPFGNLEQTFRAPARARCASAISALRCSGGCCIQLPRTTPLSVRERGGNRRMSLVSPPSEPKLMTVPVPSASKSATSPSRRPPTLSIATWILTPSAAALTRSFQLATSVAKIGDPGKIPASFAALASLRTSLMTFTPRSVRTLPVRRPTADPAPVSSVTTPVRASGGSESCAARITVRAVTVLISICAPTSSGIESGNGTTELAGTTTSSLQAPGAGKKATLRPGLSTREQDRPWRRPRSRRRRLQIREPAHRSDRRRRSERMASP